MTSFKHWNLSDSGMAFDPQSGESFHLNETARLILSLLRQGRTLEDASREIATRFAISYEQALTAALEFQVQLEMLSAA